MEDFTADGLLRHLESLAADLSGVNLIAQARAIVSSIFGEQPKKKRSPTGGSVEERGELVNPPERVHYYHSEISADYSPQ